ncbi:MAG TPA: hypothetical protein VG722_09330 [Tepidisphaeraceae bacterium]|nr:hypothetical protein [Tepidisphaeraceae bacterium]
MMFCQDSDLLYWDSLIFTYTQVGQLVLSSTGTLSDTVISVTIDLSQYDVQAGQVAILSGAVSGQFPIQDVTSSSMTISLLSAGLIPDDGSAGHAVNPSLTTGSVAFSIRTFWQYRRIISDQLLAAAGIAPSPAGVTPTLLNPQDFKRASALGALSLVYDAMAVANIGTSPTHWQDRSDAYSTLYLQAVRSIRAQLDWDGDGKADELRYLGEIVLRRE